MANRKIPRGAIKVQLSAVQQIDEYSCGAGVFMAVTGYAGAGPLQMEEVKRKLGTNSVYGTYFRDIEKYANELGFRARTKVRMSKTQLKRLLDKKIPVILVIQAYSEHDPDYVDSKYHKSGHYVVAIGYDDDDYFYFMDPMIAGRPGCLRWQELKHRWRDDQGRGAPEVYHRQAIVVRPGKGLKKRVAVRVD